MGGPWGTQGGGSKIPPPPILDPLEALILDPWDPLVMWNDDDDGDDHIKNPSANLPCADNLSRHHLDHNFYLKKSTNSVLFRRPPFLLHYAAGLCWFQVRGGVRFLGECFLVKGLFCRPFSWRMLFGECIT